MARIDEIAPDLYRVSLYVPQFDLQFNHFLIKDDEPLLFHTGMRRMFPEVRDAVAKLIDPTGLASRDSASVPPNGSGAASPTGNCRRFRLRATHRLGGEAHAREQLRDVRIPDAVRTPGPAARIFCRGRFLVLVEP
jgi:hypothetical protein